MNLHLMKYKGYAITGLVCLMVGFILAWSIKPKTKTELLAGEVKTEYRDTCVESKLLCTLTTKDSMSIYRYIREGLKSKSEKVNPKVESEVIADVKEVPDTIKEITVTKHMNNGNSEVWDTLIIIGKLKSWKRASKINEVVEVQEKSTTTTAVIAEGAKTDMTETIKFLPVEGTKSTGAYLGLSGGLLYTDKVSYQAGINIAGERLGLTLYTTPTPKEWKHFGVQLNTKLIRLSKK